MGEVFTRVNPFAAQDYEMVLNATRKMGEYMQELEYRERVYLKAIDLLIAEADSKHGYGLDERKTVHYWLEEAQNELEPK